VNTRHRTRLAVLGVLIGLSLAAQSASAQSQVRFPRSVFRFDQDLSVPLGAEVRRVTVISGALTVEGRVEWDAVVWLGDVRLAPTAVIDGSLIVVGGNVTIEDGATVGRDFVLVGGSVTAPIDFAPGSEHAVFGMPALGRGARAAVPWVLRGLLWGRPIVPELEWVWAVVGIAFALSVALVLIFGQAVRASTEVVVERPLRTFLTGILVLVIIGPLLAIFAATIVGLVVIPVLLFALLVAWTVGKVGVARGIGHRVLHESGLDRDVLTRPGVKWVILLEGINDINIRTRPNGPNPLTADELIWGYRQIIERCHAQGIKVIGATLTPAEGVPTYSPLGEVIRVAVNRWIRQKGNFDAVVDLDAATRDPQRPAILKEEFDSRDHIHPNDKGNQAMANAFDLGVFKR
jgi:lysophospholipase L1-like esterase